MEGPRARRRGWDVGERPTVRMAYFDYPEHAPTPHAKQRDENELRSDPVSRETLHARAALRQRSGWASEVRGTYKPLGKVEDMPRLGVDVRRRLMGKYRKPKIVRPLQDKESQDVNMTFSAITLIPDTATRGVVRQFEYTYYQVEVRDRVTIEIRVEALHGDPDVFVSNHHDKPTVEEYTWKSAASGDNKITISPKHPRYNLGLLGQPLLSLHNFATFTPARPCSPRL